MTTTSIAPLSMEDWIILRLLRRLAKAKAATNNDYVNTSVYLVKKYGWDTFDLAVTDIELEELALKEST